MADGTDLEFYFRICFTFNNAEFMRHLDLFSGIGGFALAARWMGWETVQFVEIDKFCQKVLNKNFQNVPIHGDIKTFDGSKYRGTVDILTGGFPCQPFSVAGKRKGKEDDRHLWPQMLRIIGEVQPRWIVGENVSGLLNWSRGLVLKQIQTDLENKGFTMFPPAVLPACGVNAPHRRDRVWIVAHSTSDYDRRNERKISGKNGRQKQYNVPTFEKSSDGFCSEGITTNSHGERLQGGAKRYETKEGAQSIEKQFEGCNQFPRQDWKNFPTEPAICRADDGIPNRVDRIKSLGNAIVPQVAFEIFKAINLLK